MRVFLLCIFVFAFASNNSSGNLTKALYSDNLTMGVVDQQSIFFRNYPKLEQNSESFMGFKAGTVHFAGVGLLKSNHNPTFVDIKDPAFMFNIKLNGDNIEIGGGIRDLNIGDWTNIMSEIMSKKEKQ
jgi:hypothetical protein